MKILIKCNCNRIQGGGFFFSRERGEFFWGGVTFSMRGGEFF